MTKRHRDKVAEGDATRPISFGGRMRAYFLAGVLVVAPISITFYIAWLILDFVDSRVTPLIPAHYNPNTYLPFGIPGLGLIILLVVITLIGAMTAGYVGRVFVRLSEKLLVRMPVISGIYSAVKQLVEAVFAKKSHAFREVVLVEWPHRGSWTLGFVTSTTAGEIQAHLQDDVVSVMVPTTPNPTGGYLVFMPRARVIPLEMSVEVAMKMILSSGIVVPPAAGIPPLDGGTASVSGMKPEEVSGT
jgi:uncharacterized membrane protein